jgi:hypothetical protein
MAWTAPRTWVAGETVTAAIMNTHVRDNLKALGDPWTAYTPTYTGLTIGNAVVTAKFIQPGKLVIGEVKIVFGSTSTFAGGFTVSLPVTAAVITVPVGVAYFNDTSAALHRSGPALTQAGGNTVAFIEAGGAGLVSNVIPFTWAVGDTLSFEFEYEAA